MRLLLPEQRELDGPQDFHDLYAQPPATRAGFLLTTDGGVAWYGGSRPLQTFCDV